MRIWAVVIRHLALGFAVIATVGNCYIDPQNKVYFGVLLLGTSVALISWIAQMGFEGIFRPMSAGEFHNDMVSAVATMPLR